MFRLYICSGNDADGDISGLLDSSDLLTFLIVKVIGHPFVDLQVDPPQVVLVGTAQEKADGFDGHTFGGFDQSGAVAAGTILVSAPA